MKGGGKRGNKKTTATTQRIIEQFGESDTAMEYQTRRGGSHRTLSSAMMLEDKLQQKDSWATRVLHSFQWCAPLVASKSGATETTAAIQEPPEALARENETSGSSSSEGIPVDTRPGGYISGELQDIVSGNTTSNSDKCQ